MHVNVGECREKGTEKTPTNPGTEEPQGRGLELGAYYSGGPSGSFCIDGFFHSISAVTPYLCHRKTFLIHEKRVLTQLCSRVIRMPSLRGARRKEGTNESALRGTGEPPPLHFLFSPHLQSPAVLKYVIPHFMHIAGRNTALFLFHLLPSAQTSFLF